MQDITWQEAGQQIRAMAAYLRQIGVKPGDNVALISKNCAHWIMADLAIWMAGGGTCSSTSSCCKAVHDQAGCQGPSWL